MRLNSSFRFIGLGVGALFAHAVFGHRAAEAAPSQYVAIDETFTMEKYDGTVKGENFHHLVLPKADQPANWVTPVNYSTGKVYIWLDVMTKPSMANNFLDICFDGDLEGYGCVSSGAYTTTGIHETAGGAWWQREKIAWTKKRTQFHVVIKNPKTDGQAGGTPESDYVPSKIHMVLTMVPDGVTYVPPTGGAGSSDGGTTPPPADASVDPGAGGGGAGGTGGSSGGGTGGTSPGAGSGGSEGSSTGGSDGSSSGGSGSGGSTGSSSGGDTGSGGTSAGQGGGGGSSSTASGGGSGGSKSSGNPSSAGGSQTTSDSSSGGSAGGCVMAGGHGRASGGVALLMVALVSVGLRRRRARG